MNLSTLEIYSVILIQKYNSVMPKHIPYKNIHLILELFTKICQYVKITASINTYAAPSVPPQNISTKLQQGHIMLHTSNVKDKVTAAYVT
jgi:hypothetical protein